MDKEQEKLVYALYKKGKENLSDFDRLIIEADPEIKKELTRLFSVDRDFYQRCENSIEDALAKMEKREKQEKKRRVVLPLLTVPAALAACLLIVFGLIFPPSSRHTPLGGKVSLFVSSIAAPDSFYRNGSTVRPGTELQLAFLLPADNERIRQGIIFSVDNTNRNHVYYRYDAGSDRLDQRSRTMLKERVVLTGGNNYIAFLAFFSESVFNETELVNNITDIILSEKEAAGKALSKKYPEDFLDYIYLLQGDL